jgi:hypothetical protein
LDEAPTTNNDDRDRENNVDGNGDDDRKEINKA